MKILSIDPGTTESAYVIMDYETYKPKQFGKFDNEHVLKVVSMAICDKSVIEMIARYGMPAGKEIFETCVWIGRFYEHLNKPMLMYRKDVKMNLCNTNGAKDGNIIQALKDRFGDKGTKAEPGFFFGFKADVWQAYALGVTYIDKLKQEGKQ